MWAAALEAAEREAKRAVRKTAGSPVTLPNLGAMAHASAAINRSGAFPVLDAG